MIHRSSNPHVSTSATHCGRCGGFIGEPGRVYGYAGKWCDCSSFAPSDWWSKQAPPRERRYLALAEIEAEVQKQAWMRKYRRMMTKPYIEPYGMGWKVSFKGIEGTGDTWRQAWAAFIAKRVAGNPLTLGGTLRLYQGSSPAAGLQSQPTQKLLAEMPMNGTAVGQNLFPTPITVSANDELKLEYSFSA